MTTGQLFAQSQARRPRFGTIPALSVDVREMFLNGPRSRNSHALSPMKHAEKTLMILCVFLRMTSASGSLPTSSTSPQDEARARNWRFFQRKQGETCPCASGERWHMAGPRF